MSTTLQEPNATTSATTAETGADNYSARRLSREVVVYAIATVARRTAAFIMLPLYTRILTPADYGVLHLLEMTVNVAAIMMSAGVTAGVMRFYLKADSDRRRHEILGSAVVLELGLNLLGTLLLVAAAHPIWTIVLEGGGSVAMIYVAAANFTLSMLGNVPMLYMQMERRALASSIAGLSMVVLQLTLNIVFLVGLGWGVMGILLSTLVTNVVVGVSLVVWTLRHTRYAFSREAVRDLRRYGVPIQIATAGSFVLTFGDRFFLQAYQGLTAVGLYGFAYQFGFIHQEIAATPFFSAWNPERFRLSGEPPAFRDAKINQGLRYLSILVVTGAVGIGLFIRPVLEVMSDKAFWPAAALVPFVVAAYVLQSWGGVVRFGIDVSERTQYVTYTMWISAGAAIALYAVLIPLFGAPGAVAATFLSFLVRSSLLYFFAQRLWPVRYDWRPSIKLVALGAISTAAAFMIDVPGVAAKAALGVVLLLGYMISAWFIALPAEERQMILELLRTSPRSLVTRLAQS